MSTVQWIHILTPLSPICKRKIFGYWRLERLTLKMLVLNAYSCRMKITHVLQMRRSNLQIQAAGVCKWNVSVITLIFFKVNFNCCVANYCELCNEPFPWFQIVSNFHPINVVGEYSFDLIRNACLRLCQSATAYMITYIIHLFISLIHYLFIIWLFIFFAVNRYASFFFSFFLLGLNYFFIFTFIISFLSWHKFIFT